MIFNPGTPFGRAMLTAGLLIFLVALACAVPTTYEAEMGKSFSIALPEGTEMPALDKALHSLEEAGVADEINVSVRELAGSGPQVELMLWGGNVNEAEVKRLLSTQNEAFGKASWDVTPLEGSVRSSLAGKLGHEIFNIDLAISEGDEESARRQIMEQLAAQGLKGDVDFQYTEEDGRQMVEIRLTDVEAEDAEKAMGEGGIIELKTNVVTEEKAGEE